MSTTQQNKAQTDDLVGRIAQVSMKIREAVRAAIPAPTEQFLTLMAPGKVIDLDKFVCGLDGEGKRITQSPACVQLEEAMLCDEMPTISAIQLGPASKSVARSYAATLSKFCPARSTTGVADGVAEETLSAAEKRYQHAMGWLTGRDPNDGGNTRVEVYREKQERYTQAFERKVTAFAAALKRSIDENPTKTATEQRDVYNMWVAENQKTYNNLVQAAYMDWVTMGRKEELEYYFSIVDHDSAMSRVEASKESMRNSVISAPDGAGDYHRVQLQPRNWAWLAKAKTSGFRKLGETGESLALKIARLENINLLLLSMQENAKLIIKEGDATTTEDEGPGLGDEKRRIASTYLEAQINYRTACEEYEKAVKEGQPDENTQQLKNAREDRRADFNEKRGKFNDCVKEVERKHLNALAQVARKAQKECLSQESDRLSWQIKSNEEEIAAFAKMQDDLSRWAFGKVAAELQNDFIDRAGIQRAPAPTGFQNMAGADYWTPVCVEVASGCSGDSGTPGASVFMADPSTNCDFLSVVVGMSHNESHKNAVRQMANASVKVSFDCMRVDITRPWLRRELFYDHDLRVPEGEWVSPGPLKLIELMEPSYPNAGWFERKGEKEGYELFPMYPTAFLVAANIVLEVTGETSDILSYLVNSSASASARINYGPFSAGGSGARTTDGSDADFDVTATGCTISIKSPQIIGQISHILPALPRACKQTPA